MSRGCKELSKKKKECPSDSLYVKLYMIGLVRRVEELDEELAAKVESVCTFSLTTGTLSANLQKTTNARVGGLVLAIEVLDGLVVLFNLSVDRVMWCKDGWFEPYDRVTVARVRYKENMSDFFA